MTSYESTEYSGVLLLVALSFRLQRNITICSHLRGQGIIAVRCCASVLAACGSWADPVTAVLRSANAYPQFQMPLLWLDLVGNQMNPIPGTL